MNIRKHFLKKKKKMGKIFVEDNKNSIQKFKNLRLIYSKCRDKMKMKD